MKHNRHSREGGSPLRRETLVVKEEVSGAAWTLACAGVTHVGGFLGTAVAAIGLVLLTLTGCAVGPDYQVPTMPLPTAYKEAGTWVRAVPADTLEKGPWWTLFGDALLNDLAAQVEVSNQNLAASVAAYDQARALVKEQRASLFPQVGLDGSGQRSGGGGATPTSGSYRASLGASWEADVWGRLRRGVEAAQASAQASAADLAAARLAIQGELATNYFSLRATDVQLALLQQTLTAYQRALTITQNRYDAAMAPRTDVLQAQTQLANAQADVLSAQRQRAQLEHAIAVLVGKTPAEFSLPVSDFVATVPDVPLDVPSTLLQRRPDIAAAERRVAQANAQIGIAESAFYPSVNLSGSLGTSAARLGDLFSASSAVWALGLSVAQTVFSGGANTARVEGARAGHQQAVANYRQTVLSAFQDVEDQLSATRILSEQWALRQQASQAADAVERQVMNRYQQGQVTYLEVISAQTTAFNARRALAQLQADRQTEAVALIQALGGGWQPVKN